MHLYMKNNLYHQSVSIRTNLLLKAGLLLAFALIFGAATAFAVPAISSFSPNQGSPGTVVSIRGTGFSGALHVRFNGVDVSYVTEGDTLVLATTPFNDTASGVITITTVAGTGISPGNYLVVIPAPAITSFTPNSGNAGTVVTMRGHYFTGTSVVSLGGIHCSFTVLNDSVLSIIIPSLANTNVFAVTANAHTTLSGSTFSVAAQQPSIISFSPSSGPVGQTVTIKGKHFATATNVKFNGLSGISAGFSILNDSTITAVVPALAQTGVIVVYCSNLYDFSSGSFVVGYPTPTLTSYSPVSGSQGDLVTLKGTNLGTTYQVLFNGTVSSYTTYGDSMLVAIVPSNATSGVITVRTYGGSVISSGNFIIVPVAPVISTFSPVSGTSGTLVTLKGHYFLGTTFVRFNGTVATFTVVNDSTITVTVPVGATTGIISVTARSLTAITSGSFLVQPATPVISTFTPVSGPVGTVVTIRGHYFTNATAVRFTGVSSGYTVLNDSTITATVPTGAVTGVITVIVAGITGTSPGSYTVQPTLLKIKSFSPTSGKALTAVTIRGNFFTGTTQVRFGNVVTSFTVVNDSTITTQVPIGAISALIYITTAAGTAQTASTFTVLPTPPIIVTFSPNEGQVGTHVTFFGHYFTGLTQVRLNGVVCSFSLYGDSIINCTVPAGATTGLFTLYVGSLFSNTSSTFTVDPATPAITDFSPTFGPVGTVVSIKGIGLLSTTQVRFNGAVASFSRSGDTLVTATVPSNASTGVIGITTGGININSPGTFTLVPATPIITSFTPGSGLVGTSVTITGHNFTGTTLVRFNGVTANFTLYNDSTLRAIVPLGATTGIIYVTANGNTGISQGTFQVLPPSVLINSFSPTTGAAGTVVTLKGTLFTGTTAVRFNGTISAFTFISDSILTAVVPAGASTGVLTVTANGNTGTSTANFVVLPSTPVITSFSPVSGSEGTVVTIKGVHFTNTTACRFNGTISSFTVQGDTIIIATVPTGATTGVITVTAAGLNGLSSGSFQVLPTLPLITSFVPSSGPPGTTVTIKGTHFTNPTQVTFGGAASGFSVQGDSLIIATVPANASTGLINITAGGNVGSSPGSFTVTPLVPIISSFSPVSGYPGTTVIIRGSNFTGLTSVKFNGATAAFTRTGDTLISVTVPANAVTGVLSATVGTQTGLSQQSFTVLAPAPSVTSIIPSSGPVGSSFIIKGSHFTGITGLQLNGTSLTSFSLINDSTLSAGVPAGATSGYVVVITPAGNAAGPVPFTVTVALPDIAGFTPAQGITGTTVLISGSNFTGTTNVLFNGMNAVFSVLNSATLSVTVPAGATTGKIAVYTEGGTAFSSTDFTVLSPPVVGNFTPLQGPAGTVVTINGSNFGGATSVTFSGAAANFTVVSSTQITAVVPAGAISGLLAVVTPAGSSTSSVVYTVTAPPVITSFTPQQGLEGSSVTLSGSNFSSVSLVLFGNLPALFNVVNANTINATVPVGAVTNLIKVISGTDTGKTASNFTVLYLPLITSFSPSQGPVGTQVTLNGTNLNGLTALTLGGQNVAFTQISGTQVQFTVPAGSAGGIISVIGPGGTAVSGNSFTVFSAPQITDFSPGSGQPGNTIIITGLYLNGTTQVLLGTYSAAFTVLSDRSISLTVPAGASTGLLQVITPGGTAYSQDAYLVLTPPVITGISPVAAQPGDTVLISGTNLAGASSVSVSGISLTFIYTAAGNIKAVATSGFGTAPVIVTTSGGADTSDLWLTEVPFAYTYCPPVYANVSCNGNYIAQVSVNGTAISTNTQCLAHSGNSFTLLPMWGGFTAAITAGQNTTLAVQAGAGTPSSVSSWVDLNRNGAFETSEYRSLTASVNPGGTATASINIPLNTPDGPLAVRIRIRTAGSPNAATDACTQFGSGQALDFILKVVAPKLPVISSISPDSAMPGTTVLVKGLNLATVNAASLNGSGLSFTLITDTSLSFVTPAAPGSWPLVLVNPTGQSASAKLFTVLMPPAITLVPFGGSYCPGDSLHISLTSAGYKSEAINYALQLSDSAGSFANPVILGTGKGTANYTYKIPAGLFGTHFRVRAVSLQPVLLSNTNGSNLVINPHTLINAGPDLLLCQGADAVSLTDATPAGGTWKGANLLPGNLFDPITPGGYRMVYTYISPSGCTDSSVRNIGVISLPAAPVISYSSPLSFCFGDSVVLSAPVGPGRIWNTGDTTRNLKVKRSGNYTLQIRNASGCLSLASAPVAVSVNPLPVAPVIQYIGNTALCTGDSIKLEAPAGYSYLWSNGARNQSVVVNQAGSYGVRISNANGCSDTSARVTITINPAALAAQITAAGALSFCAGDSVVLSATGAATYIWSNGATTGSITVRSGGNYTVTGISGFGCTAQPSVPVLVTAFALPTTPVITASGPVSFCSSDSVTLSGPAAQAGYRWSTGDTTRSITVKIGGNYQLALRNANGCTGPAAVQAVSVTQTPVATFSVNGPVLMVTSNPATGQQWLFNGFPVSGAVSDLYNAVMPGGPGTGNYSVIVYNGTCSDTSRTVFVDIAGLPVSGLKHEPALYPNPATDKLTLNGHLPKGTVMSLVNLLGETVWFQSAGSNLSSIEIPIQGLPRGLYILQLVIGSERVTKQVSLN